MKIAMTLLVRDEIDIIKYHIMYHLPKVDLMIITDNGSVDGTWEYLKKLKSKKLVLVREPKHDYLQHVWVKNMIEIAIGRDADWVINSDVDEFWVGDLRREIMLQATLGHNVVSVEPYFFVTTYMDDENEVNPLFRIRHRNEASTVEYAKLMHSVEGFKDVAQGNHKVWFKEGVDCSQVMSTSLRINHYWERGWGHFKRKYLQGGEAYANSSIKDAAIGQRWRDMYEIHQREGEIGLRRMFYADSYIKDAQTLSSWPRVVIDDNSMTDEFTRLFSNMSARENYRVWSLVEHRAVGHARFLDSRLLTQAIEMWSPTSMIDLGCGEGHYSRLAKKLGVDKVTAVDATPEINEIAVFNVDVHDLSEPVDLGKHDLAWCIEVGEHMPEESSRSLVENCTKHADRVVFSASPPGQVGIMHINCRPWSYWQLFFNELGYVENSDASRRLRASSDIIWLRENLRVLEKKESPS